LQLESELLSGVSKPLTTVAKVSAIKTDEILNFMIGGLAAYTRGFKVQTLNLKAARAVSGSFSNSPITSGKS
jgi:hypothetical protein